MAASLLCDACFEGELFIGTYSLGFHEADHARCRRGETTPGLLGGWHCSCECNRSRSAGSSRPEAETED